MNQMTFTLTEALMLAGAAVLLALLGHGWWIARRARPRDADQAESRRSEPGLLGGSGAETDSDALASVLDALHAGDAAAQAANAHADTLPMISRAGHKLARRASQRLDSVIDVIATLHVEAPVSGEAAVAHLPPSRRAGSKPLAIEGLNTNSGDWEPPQAGERYGEFQAGLQMANRSGALTEIEFSEWVQKVQAFADGVGANADFPDMLEAVAQGRELDQFASQHDAQMGFLLRARGAAWTPGFIQQTAGKLRLIAGSLPGRLVLPGATEGEPPLLWLQFDAQAALAEDGGTPLREVALNFDVAQTPEALEPFAALQELARRLSRELDAELVDEAGRPIGPHAFAAINDQLGTLYRSLASRELAAGSVAARRLFS